MMIMVMKEGIMVMIFFGHDDPSNNATDYVDGDEEKRGIPGTFENDGWLRLNRTRAPEFLRLHCPRRNFTLTCTALCVYALRSAFFKFCLH